MAYDRIRQATYRTHIRNAAVENDLYTIIDTEGNPSDFYEAGWLQWFDNAIARILPKLLEERPVLTTGDRGMVSLFLALQHVRTPYMREQILNVVDLTMRIEIEEGFTGISSDDLDQAIEEWDPNISEADEAQLRRIALDPSQPIDMNTEYWIRSSLRLVPDLAEGLESREWSLVRAQNAAFLTGDIPVALGGFHPLHLSDAPYICWPLSPTKMLRLDSPGSFNGRSYKVMVVTEDFAHDVNQLIADQSAAQIYWHPETDPVDHITLPVGPHVNTVNGITVQPGERYFDVIRTEIRRDSSQLDSINDISAVIAPEPNPLVSSGDE